MTEPRIHITQHAKDRWRERIDPAASDAEAEAAIRAHTAAVNRAIAFGAERLKLPDGTRLHIKGVSVVTVTSGAMEARTLRIRSMICDPNAPRRKRFAKGQFKGWVAV